MNDPITHPIHTHSRLNSRGTTRPIAIRSLPGRMLALLGILYLLLSVATVASAAPANDLFAYGILTGSASATGSGSNVGATKETGEPTHAGNSGGKSVWWSWTAPSAGSVTVNTFGSTFDTVLGVYMGSSVSGLGTVAANDDSGGLQSSVTFSATAGATYRIAVDGYNGASGNISLRISQTVAGCTYSISSSGASIASAGGSGSVSVTAGTGCAWSAISGSSWITITAGSSGSGNGTVGYWVAANTSSSSRSATLTIAGKSFAVSQAAAAAIACTYSIYPTSASVASASSSGNVSVTTGSGCNRTATSGAAWITITAGSSGTGSGTVSYSVAANTSTTSRFGTMTIAGQTFTVSQAAGTSSCTYSISGSTASFGSAGGPGSIGVTAGSGCNWTASSSVGWVTISGGSSGTGNGSVGYYVGANTGGSRSGTLSIAGRTFTVSQVGATCTYTISPTSGNVGSAASSGTLTVTAGAGCNWTPSSSAPAWLTCTPASGTGSGAVTWSVAANTSTSSRTATLSIAGQTFTVTQAGTVSAAGPWVRGFGGAGGEVGQTVATDGSGNIITAGYFQGSANFGGGTLTSSGGYDLVIAKCSADGAHVWSKRFGGTGDEFVKRVAVDASGNVFVGGNFRGTTDLGGGPLSSSGGLDMFVAKYSASGAFVWAKRFGSANGDDSANDIAVDAGGNVIVTGHFTATVNFGGATFTSPYLGINTFLAKFSPTGAHLWSQSFASYSTAYATGVSVDATGNVFMAGYFLSDINLGGGTFSTRGGSDAFVAKFSSAGTHVWSKSFGGTMADQALGIAADPSGNVVVLGFFTTSTDFGGGTLTTAGGWDTFVAKYSATGAYVWAKSFSAPGNFDMPKAIGVDRNGNVVVTGYFTSTINLGGGLLSAVVSGVHSTFVAKYASSGAHVWSERFGGTGSLDSVGIATDGTGNVIVTGCFSGTGNFGGSSLNCAGSTDVYLLRLEP